MTNKSSQRSSYFLALCAVILLLASAEYLELYKGVTPCPLCMLQRYIIGLLGVIFLLGTFIKSKTVSRIILGFFTILIAGLGIFTAGRQVWLQYFPPNTNGDCEASLQYMLSVLPLDQVITKVFQGGSTCSQVGWEFLHVSLAQWSLLSFIVFFLFGIRQLIRK